MDEWFSPQMREGAKIQEEIPGGGLAVRTFAPLWRKKSVYHKIFKKFLFLISFVINN
jgi:hypothetical protein